MATSSFLLAASAAHSAGIEKGRAALEAVQKSSAALRGMRSAWTAAGGGHVVSREEGKAGQKRL